jgi:hypothetical protein
MSFGKKNQESERKKKQIKKKRKRNACVNFAFNLHKMK